MKLKLVSFLLVFLCSFANQAFAGNEGPVGSPAAPTPGAVSEVLAQLQIMSVVPKLAPQLFEIDSDGSASVTEALSHTVLTTLPQSAVQLIQTEVDGMVAGNLIDTTPTSPKCMGSPTQEYRAVKQDGTVIVFARIEMCHLMLLQNSNSNDLNLRMALDGLKTLANLASGEGSVLLGAWGSPYANLRADETGVSIQMGCGSARIPNEVAIDAQGSFEVDGSTFQGGGAEPVGGYRPIPAHFSGHVSGDQMDITISHPQIPGDQAYTYHFQFGVTSTFPVCA